LRLTHDALLREIEHHDVLLHTIINDLAAPLHGLLGMLSLLVEQPGPGRRSEWARRALEEALRQKEIIVEILEIYSAEQSVDSPAPSSALDVERVLEQVVAELRPNAERSNVRIQVEPCAGQCQVMAEQRRLVRVLDNLVDNALQRSPSGSIVRVKMRSEGEWIWVGIEDRGPPVPLERIPRLFEKFPRGRDATFARSGLGLYFCRITVESWRGGIGYEIGEEGHARFWVRLPARSHRAIP